MRANRTRHTLLIALLLLVLPFTAACGAAEEPAPEPADAETAPEPEPEPAPVAPAEEPEAPQEPQIVGDILLSGEDFNWGDITDDTQAYTWTARVQNDTTSNLTITVRFQFLDGSDTVTKTETASVTLAPASGRTISRNGTMPYDDALRVEGFMAEVLDFAISG